MIDNIKKAIEILKKCNSAPLLAIDKMDIGHGEFDLRIKILTEL